MILRKIAFSLFFITAIIFYFLIYKTFKYTNSQGYKIIHPFPELFKFLHSCSKIQKEINDNNLKFLICERRYGEATLAYIDMVEGLSRKYYVFLAAGIEEEIAGFRARYEKGLALQA